jgi:hypothetical protein
VPKFIQDAQKNRKLSEIHVHRDIVTIELLIKSEEPITDFEYDILIKNWTSEGVEFQIDFTNPLALSRNKIRDDFSIKIVDKSMFLSNEGLMELSDEQCTKIFSIPRQFSKESDPDAIESAS